MEIGNSKGGAREGRRAWIVLALAALGCLALELVLRTLEARAQPVAGPYGIVGYRGSAFAPTRDERGVRLLVVGDDVAYGAALPEEHTWPRQLESLFARDGTGSRVEVINAAEREADLERVLEQVRGPLLELHPTWLVVCVGASDAVAALAAPESKRRAPLALLRAFAPRDSQRPAPELPRHALGDLARKAAFDFGVQLAQLVEAARRKHARVLVVLAPREWPDSAQDRARSEQRGVVPAGRATAELQHALHEEARRIALACGVRVLDARQQLSALADARSADGELNAQGALALSRLVHEDLRRARL